jgi:hypothetical protein
MRPVRRTLGQHRRNALEPTVPAPRTLLRAVVLGGLTGALALSAAWAGVGFTPVPGPTLPGGVAAPATGGAGTATSVGVALRANPARLAPGQALVGAAKMSIAPRPKDMAKRFPGARWETDPAECRTLEQHQVDRLTGGHATEPLDGFASNGTPWPENPDCIYMGGFGIGPMNPVRSFDTVDGLWVRAMAISDGSQTLVLTVIDAEGWLWDYRSKCTDCGAKQISEALAADPALKARGVTAASFVLHSSHSHSAPDFIGGWGFVPDWYMAQVTDTIKATARKAVLSLERARLETGEVEARAFNHERRDTYRSAEEQQLSWLRARSADGRRTLATLGAYAAHPTTRGTNGGVASPDWVGPFENRLEQRFGGVGLHVMTGLGNMSASGGTGIGGKLADLVPAVGQGRPVTDTDLRLARTSFRSPLTNVPLDALGTPGFFDRRFDAVPAAVSVGENPDAPCVSASPQSVELPVTVARLGRDVVLTTGPGEEFSNLTNTIKDKNAGKVVFPIAQANDALGYMPQSFELNPVGQQGLGFAFGGYVFVNYEDSYAIDRCVGDGALETTLAALAALK